MISSEFSSALVNHLWQSTVVVGIAWLLTLALRKNHARVRYLVWMAASLKFLLPFSLLMSAGEWLRSLMATPIVAKPALANAMEQIAQPFPQAQVFDATEYPAAAHHGSLLPILLFAIWAFGALVVAIRFGRGWWKVYAARRAAQRTSNCRSFDSLRPLSRTQVAQDDKQFMVSQDESSFDIDVPVLSSPALIEPGIFGIFRPALLLPGGILERLTPEQLRAILAHEMCHVRRRDNLTFAIHMVVETLFWFHLAVWWIGARLIEERERACDEAVLHAGGEASAYAEGILRVCKFYVESPVACVAGVTGADLKKRIVRIMTAQVVRKLTVGRRILLGAAASLAVIAPIAVGLIYAGRGLAQQLAESADAPPVHFEVASIKPDLSDRMTLHFEDDGVVCTSVPVEFLVQQAYGVEGDQIVGLPAWAKTEHYRIEAKVDDADVPRWKLMKTDERDAAFKTLLASRFAFKAHFDTSERNIYALVVAKNGPRLLAATAGDLSTNGMKSVAGSPLGRNTVSNNNGKITIQGGKMDVLAKTLAHQGLGYPIVDRTGLTGNYDIAIEWTPGNRSTGDDSGSELSIYTALEEQLGLKLELQKGPVEMVVVDHIEQPSAN